MIDYDLTLCYGIIISADEMQKIKEALTDEEYDELMENYSRCIDSWIDDNYFIGIMSVLPESKTHLVYHTSAFFAPSNADKNLINFKQFFNEHDLWKFIDWKPELLLINFCY